MEEDDEVLIAGLDLSLHDLILCSFAEPFAVSPSGPSGIVQRLVELGLAVETHQRISTRTRFYTPTERFSRLVPKLQALYLARSALEAQ
jgi:hypothetical protein